MELPDGQKYVLPPHVITAANSIISRDDETKKRAAATWSAENEERSVSKYADDLPQLDNGVKISPGSFDVGVC